MIEWLELFIGFLLANVFGYGGGPASIPLIYEEAVVHRDWLTPSEFSNAFALGNSLPGPIATKMAAYVGYDVAGWPGVFVALAATAAPTAVALIALIGLLQKYKHAPAVKGMMLYVQPVIAVLMALVTWETVAESVATIGWLQFIAIAAGAYYFLQIRRVHPAFVIVGAFVYGGVFLS